MYSHEQLYIHIYIQKHIKHNKDKIRHFFRKIYLSLYWKGCVWEGVGDWTELQRIDLHSYGHNSVFFPFSSVAQPGAWDPAFLGHSPHSSIFSPTDLRLWTPTAQSGILRAPTAGYWFSLQHLIFNCLTSYLHPGYVIVLRPPSSERHKFRTQFNPSTVKVISWYSSTRCTCYLHRCISYFDSLARSEVNIQQ